ncbi:ABC transporter permease [Cellulomonas soli]|uniref:Peptide ABC transporter permease n=1 Tax=Cellulomonas soli TaxID=931535 RepID=A0A512PDK8_9CELL|nr:ABC transporter permease [Cellulomonas soli]NYI60049.1 peptide/nickel transport system permease protein [Cellulomonas soli]GEP69297.1 peptide ABC transporter permease [Cellulomonas soli]
MTGYLLRRAAQGVFVLWAAFTLAFAILYLLPSDPVAIMASSGGEQSAVDPALLADLRAQYGLDRSAPAQYLDALRRAVRLDFGSSYQSGAPATQLILDVLPQTLQLTAAGLLLAVVLGVGLAVASTYPRARWVRHALASLPPLGVSLPVFWVGLMLVQLFSFRWSLLPAMGNDGPAGLVLPAVALAVPTSASIAQLLARSLRSTLTEPYIETARAKGAGRARVHLRHALRNASLPALTVLGVVVGQLLSGAVVTETVFSRAGLGRLTVSAVNTQDIPVVMAVVVFSALVFVVVALVTDLLYPLLDPRISLRQTSASAA